MSVFRRILVPVDFSAPSTAAWRLAGRLGSRESTVIALNVVATPAVPNVAYANVPAAVEEQRRENEARVAQLEAPEASEGLRVERRVVVGDVAKTIVETAHAIDADLVVIGSRRHEGLTGMLHNSVTEDVVRDVRCHVLVVRAA